MKIVKPKRGDWIELHVGGAVVARVQVKRDEWCPRTRGYKMGVCLDLSHRTSVVLVAAKQAEKGRPPCSK